MRKLRLILFLLTAFAAYAGAQSTMSYFRHITEEDGLSSNQVRAVIQDRFGYIWMGTDQGLDRYDGSVFRSYSLDDHVLGATVMSLCEDGPVIWVGTDKGLSFYSFAEDKIKPFVKKTADGTVPVSEVNSLVMDKDENLWMSTLNQGVFKYSSKTETLEQFMFPECGNQLSYVYVDSSNQVWALTNWGTPVLYKLNKASDEFEPFYMHKNGVRLVKGGLVLLEDSELRFWLGSWDSGLYEIDRITGQITRHLDISDGVNHIHDLLEYAPGKILISSDDGVLFYTVATRETTTYVTENHDDLSISSRFVYPLMKDREGGVWAGTYYGGVNYLSPFNGQFDSFPRGNPSRHKIGKVVGRFCEDGFHNIWIASDDGGLSRYNRQTGEVKSYMSQSNVHALCVDGDNLWIGTYAEGISVMNIRTGRMKSYFPVEGDDSSIDGTSSYAIFKDKDSQIWVTTMSGIHLYDKEHDRFQRMKKCGTTIIDIDQDVDGNLWFSTLGEGIMKYDAAGNEWTSYICSGAVGALPSDYVNCGLRDSRGRMMFGTARGLCVYDEDSDSFAIVELPESLTNVKGIVEDQQVFWITTAHGLVRYDPADEDLRVFTIYEGLQSNQFISNSIFKASDGCIYVGTANGFNAFEPYQIRMNSIIPQVVITSPEAKISKGSPCIELDYKDNGVTIRFASLSYCSPGKNQYAYMLKGFDKDWNYVGNQNWATYTNLPSGTYSFLVKGSNNDGVWNEEPVGMRVVVHPHFLLSAPFMIFYSILAVLIFIYALVYTARRSERKYETKMKELSSDKEREIFESKIEFFTMIAHEIRTPVSLIIAPLEKVMKKTDQLPENVSSDLKMINHNSQRLLYLVNQLLDFRKVEQDGMKMRFMSQPLAPLMREICERFEPTITYNGARLIVDYPPEDFTACVDSEAMIKLISNLLTNAGKYTKDLVRLACNVHPADTKMFNISVYDNGCGISMEEQEKIFRPFYQTAENKPGTGIGLTLVKSIAELHGGIISVKSEPGKYTVFTATLPIFHDEAGIPETTASDGIKPVSDEEVIEDILTSDLVEIQPEYKPCVMIVDDNEEMVNFLTMTFSESYQILSAINGVDALELLKSHPDVVLIVADWMMPEMDGVELCRQVRGNTETSHIPYILLTAKTDDASKVVGMDCGADAYIEKPFSVQYLEACIRNLVGLRTMLRQRYSSSPLVPLTAVANNNVDSQFLQNMTEIIEAHFADSNLSVDFLTEQMGISRSSLYNKIKSLTDKTPNELIQLMRLKKAAQLLSENRYRINEICYMVGFNNPSYFSKCFYKQFGMKPGEFLSKSVDKQ